MKYWAIPIALLLLCPACAWLPSLAVAKDEISFVSDFSDTYMRSLLQSTPPSNICPETEYYCGPGDAFEKEVHNALNQPKGCDYDNG